MKNGWWGILIL